MSAALVETSGLVLDLPDMSRPRGFGPRPMLRILDRIDFIVGRGETVGIVGESGSGKTSLGRSLVGLYKPSAGRVMFDGEDLSKADAAGMRRRVQMIFQDPQSSFNPRRTIGRSLATPLLLHHRPADAETIAALMQQVDLDPRLMSRYPHQLSGGQRQRAGIARAVALKPEFVVADEIVSGLDVSTQAQVLNLLKHLGEELGLALAFISHDLSVIRHICSRVYIMRGGRIVEEGKVDDIFKRPRSHYARQLIAAIPLPVPDPNWLTRDGDGDEYEAKSGRRGTPMDVKGAVALVTGANRGLGRSFVEALAARGARKIYVGTRKLGAVKGWTIEGCDLVPVKLDVTKPDEIRAAAKLAKDVTILVNNAGVNFSSRLLEAKKKNAAQLEMEANYFAPVAMARAFAPIIAKNGGGAIVNVLSILALVNMPGMGSYSASKAAAHSASQAMRAEFAGRKIQVLSVLPGVMDTDMMAHYPPPKLPPSEAAGEVLDALAAGEWEVYPGEMAKGMLQGHKADPIGLHKQMMQYL